MSKLTTGVLCVACAVLLFFLGLMVMRFGFSSHYDLPYNSIYAHLLVDGEIKKIAHALKQQQQVLKPNDKLDILFSTLPQDGTQPSLNIAYIQATDTTPLTINVRNYLQANDYRAVPCPMPCTPNTWVKATATIQIVEHANHQSLEIIKSEFT